MQHNLEKENSGAKRLIDNLVNVIQERFSFGYEHTHPYMKDGISKVIVKGNLRIYFFWDYRESQIS